MLERVMAAHPRGPGHVMQLLGTHEHAPDLWLALEKFDHTVEELAPERMTPMVLMTVAYGSVKGLVEIEQAGIVDDDVTPKNIAFKSDNGHVAHIDLGYARLPGDPPRGYTEQYAAPEIVNGVPSDTSACYGWARTIEFLCYGRADLGPHHSLHDLLPWVGPRLASLVVACTLPNPERRPSVSELAHTVRDIVRHRRRCPCSNAIMFRDGVCPNCGRCDK